MSFRQANCLKHMQALRKAIPLFYAFDHINYKGCAPLYYEDCLALPNKFPKLYEAFCKGDFVVTLFNISNNDEYSLHHEFSPSVTENVRETVSNIIDYINEHVNPFRTDENTLVNLAAGVKFDT